MTTVQSFIMILNSINSLRTVQPICGCFYNRWRPRRYATEKRLYEGLHSLQGQYALEDWNTAYYVIPANDP